MQVLVVLCVLRLADDYHLFFSRNAEVFINLIKYNASICESFKHSLTQYWFIEFPEV